MGNTFPLKNVQSSPKLRNIYNMLEIVLIFAPGISTDFATEMCPEFRQ